MKKVYKKFKLNLEEVCLIKIEKSVRSNPIKAKALKFIYGKETGEWVSLRAIQEAIRNLRLSGIPICANGDGYYFPEGDGELKRYIKSVRSRSRELNKMIKELKKKYGSVFINTDSIISSI